MVHVVKNCWIYGFKYGVADSSYLGNLYIGVGAEACETYGFITGNKEEFKGAGIAFTNSNHLYISNCTIIASGKEGEYFKKHFSKWQLFKLLIQKIFKK